VPIRVGRWRIPGRPRTILVEFSGLYERKDQVLAELWERFHVDSLFGGWEYIEPLMFGHACGIVIEQFWQEFVAPYHHDAVAQFHEWMSASGALYIKHNRPSIGTVFTAHSTALGRVLSSTGQSPTQGLAGQSPEELAEAFGMRSVHSLEGVRRSRVRRVHDGERSHGPGGRALSLPQGGTHPPQRHRSRRHRGDGGGQAGTKRGASCWISPVASTERI
jgi:hypothetical protein